ncbi:hypothetical protein B0H10DRAFT_938568 [Mycena sp. CBHHK59/15]|nr:hypothetical protein B0H10DRAFT_938568 [Mycena sp. CBHHK59/15]
MRALGESVYQSKSFIPQLQASGFGRRMQLICQPGNLVETSHPDVELSFRFHNWRMSYGELICRWISPTIQPAAKLELAAKQPGHPFSVNKFLIFFSSHPRMHPWRSNPMAAFLFLTLYTFRVNWEIWLGPCLSALGHDTNGWKLPAVYRTLMRDPIMQHPAENPDFVDNLEPKLRTVILQTAWHHDLLKSVKKEVFRPTSIAETYNPDNDPRSIPESSTDDHVTSDAATSSAVDGSAFPTTLQILHTRRKLKVKGLTPATISVPKTSPGSRRNQRKKERKRVAALEKGTALGITPPTQSRPVARPKGCRRCRNQPPEKRCIRVLHVEENLEASDYVGCAFTCAPEGDRLKPKPWPRRVHRKSEPARKQKPVRYVDPVKDLNFQVVGFREDVYKNCGQDIVRFIHRRSDGAEVQVGGVRFKTFSSETLQILQEHHRLIRVRAIRRRSDMEAWAYGTMTAAGSRMPMGGRKGDGYAPYACHRGDSVDDIKALFRQAVDSDILIAAAQTIYPGIKREVHDITELSEANRLGSFAVTSFYCTNYINIIHSEKDAKLEDLQADEERIKKEEEAVLKKEDGLEAEDDEEEPDEDKDYKAYENHYEDTTLQLNSPHPPAIPANLYPCVQTEKKNCSEYDYGFVMVRWRIVILTEENAVWVFHGGHEHGTAMPSQSAVNKGAMSLGTHDDNRKKDINRARQCARIRHGYNLRPLL